MYMCVELWSAERQNAEHLKESSSRRIDLNERDDRCCIASHAKFKSHLLPLRELIRDLLYDYVVEYVVHNDGQDDYNIIYIHDE